MTSPFRVIADGLGLSGVSKVGLVRVYGDAGGNRDLTNIALGAYYGTVDQWDGGLRKPWQDALDDEGLECFHRSEMETFWKGELKDKGWDRNHQIAVLQRLHQTIKTHTTYGVGQAVPIADFQRLMPSDIQKKYGGPYGWCVLRTIVWFGTWARANNDWVHYFFEAGDLGQRKINQAIKELYDNPDHREMFRIASWTFAPKKGPMGVIQLQPSDFIAFEAYKRIENYYAGEVRAVRKSFIDLLRPKIDSVVLWTAESMAGWRSRLQECGGDVVESLIVRNAKPFELNDRPLWGLKCD